MAGYLNDADLARIKQELEGMGVHHRHGTVNISATGIITILSKSKKCVDEFRNGTLSVKYLMENFSPRNLFTIRSTILWAVDSGIIGIRDLGRLKLQDEELGMIIRVFSENQSNFFEFVKEQTQTIQELSSYLANIFNDQKFINFNGNISALHINSSHNAIEALGKCLGTVNKGCI
ncbi:hypothetical protein Cyrtocomes_00789 [Candidatus Cyrtobacter comes]|uniref:Homing endonuclease LAGLIDADG domain-containing protein n=1 Tax=Candidatus Cyrtobacter comes TaxID=675776 RepID=A0ABU5L8G8_9RICK|nr:hypothetical protein [Candidatus Cyrtobacter comes]MDZ5762409.1 hypothetical protein [Candidatus Cyrtobacter comes]